MASEIRVDKITSLSGVGTITPSPTGIDIAGITTAATLRATTGIVTSLTAVSSAKVGSGVTLSPDGDIFATGVTTSTTFVGNLTGNVTGTLQTAAQTNITSLGTLTSATISGDLTIADSIVHSGDTDTKIRFPSANQFTVETAGTERLKLDRSSDQSHLYVIGDDTGLGARLFLQNTNTTSGAQSSVECLDQGGQSVSGIKFHITDHSNNEGFISMFTRPSGGTTTEAIRIDSSGNMGLGINAPTAASSETALHIYANEYPEVHLTSSVTGSNAGDGSIFTLNNDSSTIIRNQENSYIRFDTNGSNERMRIHAGGTVNIPSGITLGSAISSTDAANTLDDYEEGTWTPDWRGASALGTTTYGSYNVASYVKIGNQVTVRGYSELNGSSGGSGFWFINNLPFTVGGGDDRRYRSVGSVMIENFNLPDDVLDVVLYVERNNNDAQLRGIVDNATSSANISVNNDTNFEIYFTVTYPTV